MAFLRNCRALGACTVLVVAVGCGGGGSSGPASSTELEPADKGAPGAVTNDTPATAEAITAGRPMFGTISDSTDVDHFTFHATAGQLLTVDAYAMRFDAAHWGDSPRLRLLAPDGTTALYTNGPDQDLWAYEDPGIALVPIPADGDYYVAIDGQSNGDVAATYALRVVLSSAPGSLQHEQETAEQTGVNSTRATAEPIVPGVMAGFYANNDPDFYSFTVGQQTRVRFTMTADRNGSSSGGTAYDTYLYLRNATGNEITSNDDTWYLDSSVEAVIPAGDYFIEVNKFSGANPTDPYLLAFEVLPLSPVDEAAGNDTPETAMHIAYGTTVRGTFTAGEEHLFAFTGTAGDLVRVYLLETETLDGGAVLDSDLDQVSFSESSGGVPFVQGILRENGTYYLDVWGIGTAGTFAFRLERFASARWESEPNGAPNVAGSFDGSGWAAGVIDVAEESDGFAFDASADQLVTVALLAQENATGAAADGEWGSTLDAPQLDIYDAELNLVTSTAYATANDITPSSVVRPTSMIEAAFRAPVSGRYYAVVTSSTSEAESTAVYALKLRKNE